MSSTVRRSAGQEDARPVTAIEIRNAPDDGVLRFEAWDDDSRIGEATARPVQLFEHEHFCEVRVDQDRRRQGIGTALYAALDRALPKGEALVCRLLHGDGAAVGFAGSIGHDLVELCPAPQADPSAPAWEAWAARQAVPDGAVAVRSDEVPAADLEEAWVDYYVWAHESIGPLRPRDVVAAASSGIADHLDHAASTLILRDGAIVALSLVFDEVAEDGIIRVLAETPRIDEPGGIRLVAAAVASTLAVLGGRGVRVAELEGRTFDPHVPAVVATFPPHSSNPMSVVRLHRSP
jgi:GNAT superfamily N-acetyltransferase